MTHREVAFAAMRKVLILNSNSVEYRKIFRMNRSSSLDTEDDDLLVDCFCQISFKSLKIFKFGHGGLDVSMKSKLIQLSTYHLRK